MRGDINGDSKINLADVNYLLNYIAGTKNYIVNNYDGDLNKDSKVDLADVNYLLKYIARDPNYTLDEEKTFTFKNFKFNYEIGISWFNGELQEYVDTNVDVSENSLKINLINRNNKVSSSRIVSNYSNELLTIRKGEKIKLTINAKMPECYLNNQEVSPDSTDIWPAFWLMGEELKGESNSLRQTYWRGNTLWPKCCEIDILEWVPSFWKSQNQNLTNQRVFYAIHLPDYSADNAIKPFENGKITNIELHKSFNNYSIEIFKGTNEEDSYIEFLFNNISYYKLKYEYRYRHIWNTMKNDNTILDSNQKIYGLLINIAYSGMFTAEQDIQMNKISNATLEIKDINVIKEKINENESEEFILNTENIKILNDYSDRIILNINSNNILDSNENNNVYDFTDWSIVHPGGSTNIKKWANEDDNYTLIYPNSHSKSRFEQNKTNLLFINKLNNKINYNSLPDNLKNTNLKKNLIYI